MIRDDVSDRPVYPAVLIEADPSHLVGVACSECGRGYGLSHLGSCSGSTMHGGSGIVGYRVVSDRHDTIVFLLERYEDALMERMMVPNGRNGHDAVLLMPGPWWHSPAFQDLARCLDKMRNQARQQAVTYAPDKTCSLGCARWHVLAWYVSAERRTVMRWKARLDERGRERRGKNGQVLGERQPVLEVQRHRDAREDKARAGVDWIVGEFTKWTAAGTVREHWQDDPLDEGKRHCREKVAA